MIRIANSDQHAKPSPGGEGFKNRDKPMLRFGDFAAAQAAGANAQALVAAALHLGVDGPQIDVPAATLHVVRVADVVSELRLLAADCTNLCHE
jgi:hypothetical protein